MDLFVTRFHFWHPTVELTDDIINYYKNHYSLLNAPIDSIIADLSNHFQIERKVIAPENILSLKFYDRLKYIIYNGPPETLYARYTEPVTTENEIANAIIMCIDGLYECIINPSIIVMGAYCRKWVLNLDRICNPPRELYVECIKYDPDLYPKYKHLFSDNREALEINPHIIKFLESPSDNLKLFAVKKDISALKSINEQNYEICEYVSYELKEHHLKYLIVVTKSDPFAGSGLQRGIAYTKLATGLDFSYLTKIQSREYPIKITDFKLFNDVIVDNLICIPEFIFSLNSIPESYWSNDRLRLVLKSNPQILKSYPILDASLYEVITNKEYYPYIPDRYQTKEIKTIIEDDPNLKYKNERSQKEFAKRVTINEWKNATEVNQDLCNRIFDIDPYQFSKIPAQFHTDHMIRVVIERYYSLIPYINNLTRDMALEIIRKNPDAIEYIPLTLHTEEICRLAVTSRGYNLKWCGVITNSMLTHIFKTTQGKRCERFLFLHKYSESELLRILEVRPNLLMYLKPEQQTDTIIKRVLSLDGFVYQYVVNKKPEYLELAMLNEPRAIKYK